MQPVPLPIRFFKPPFQFDQIKRSQSTAIYRKSKGPISSLEVILIQILPPKSWPDGHTSPLREAFPPSESWGSKGFTYSKNSHLDPLASANTKFWELSKNQVGN